MLINTFTIEVHHNGIRVTSYPDWQEGTFEGFYMDSPAPEALAEHLQKYYGEEEDSE